MININFNNNGNKVKQINKAKSGFIIVFVIFTLVLLSFLYNKKLFLKQETNFSKIQIETEKK